MTFSRMTKMTSNISINWAFSLYIYRWTKKEVMMLTNIGGYQELHINLHSNVPMGVKIYSPRMAEAKSSGTPVFMS